MERVSIYKFYKLGKLISETDTISEDVSNLEYYNHITYIVDTINKINLPNSKKLIFSKLNATQNYFFKISGTNPEGKINKLNFEKAKKVINEIKHILKPELLEKFSYIPSEKKLNSDKLIDHMYSFFNEGFFLQPNLDSISFNIVESGRCYVFALYTAASIHIVKATEEYNRYFNEIIKKNDSQKKSDNEIRLNNNFNKTKKLIPKSNKELIDSLDLIKSDYKKEIKYFKDELTKCEKDKSWNDILKETEGLISENIKKKEIIDSLHFIKNKYRNQIIHCNKMLFHEEASDLFDICTNVINKMDKILKTSNIH